MKSCVLTSVAAAATAGLPFTTAQAQTANAAPAAPPSAFEQFVKDSKNPIDWLNWGADLRVRNEYMNNIVSLTDDVAGHEQDVIRYRGRVWASATVMTNLTFNGRFSAEPREWLKPAFVGAYKAQSGMEWRYGMADNLNVKWTGILDQPLSVTAGRQDILLGDYYDWWLVADGTPGDGSWTFYLDSIRVTYDAKEIKTKFDLMYIYQNPLPGEWVPTLGRSSDYPVTDQREQGLIAYVSNKSIKNTQIDGYFIAKHDDRETFLIANVPKTPGDNGDVYTVGGKVTGTPIDHWQYSVEGAYQFGRKEDIVSGVNAKRDIDAYGGKAKLTYDFKDAWKNQISLGGEFLSGDDPNSGGKDEMFDILWGRWPRWSELYIYSYINETGGRVAQLNNIGRFGPSWSCSPSKKLTLSAMYNALVAPEATPTRRVPPAAGLFSYDGHFRGHYLQAVAKYQFSKNLNAHFWAEEIWEGDYYSHRDLLTFLRAEVLFTW